MIGENLLHLPLEDEDLPRFLRFLAPLSPLAAAGGFAAGTRCRKLPPASGSCSSSDGSRYRWFLCINPGFMVRVQPQP